MLWVCVKLQFSFYCVILMASKLFEVVLCYSRIIFIKMYSILGEWSSCSRGERLHSMGNMQIMSVHLRLYKSQLQTVKAFKQNNSINLSIFFRRFIFTVFFSQKHFQSICFCLRLWWAFPCIKGTRNFGETFLLLLSSQLLKTSYRPIQETNTTGRIAHVENWN